MKTNSNYKKDYHALKTNNSEDKTCCIKFSHCDDNKYQLQRLNKEEIKKFVSYVKKVETLKWQQIKTHKGLKYETLSDITPPSYIDENITIKSMRVDGKFRVVGFRSNEFYYILWFDNNHETCQFLHK